MVETVTTNIIELDSFRKDPHIVFPTLDRNVHVIPVSVIEDWARGTHLESLQSPENEMLLRSIINDWKVRSLCL